MDCPCGPSTVPWPPVVKVGADGRRGRGVRAREGSRGRSETSTKARRSRWTTALSRLPLASSPAIAEARRARTTRARIGRGRFTGERRERVAARPVLAGSRERRWWRVCFSRVRHAPHKKTIFRPQGLHCCQGRRQQVGGGAWVGQARSWQGRQGGSAWWLCQRRRPTRWQAAAHVGGRLVTAQAAPRVGWCDWATRLRVSSCGTSCSDGRMQLYVPRRRSALVLRQTRLPEGVPPGLHCVACVRRGTRPGGRARVRLSRRPGGGEGA